MSEWQPIETAPKNVEVLVFAPRELPQVFTAEGERSSAGVRWTRQAGDIIAERDDYFGDPHPEPTHWMPLPEPPPA